MITALAPRDTAMAMLSEELASSGRTKRSLGVLYGLCLAAIPHEDKEAWRSINEPIRNATDIRYLDHVKTIGWNLYEAVAKRHAAA